MTKFTYDANDNLTAVTSDFGGPLARTTALEYDALDRVVKITDPAGHARRFDYPYHESVSKITHPDGTTTRFEYDARRALSAVLDEAGNRAAFERDADEQLIQATSPEQRIATLERDALGAVTARIDHTGDRTVRPDGDISRLRCAVRNFHHAGSGTRVISDHRRSVWLEPGRSGDGRAAKRLNGAQTHHLPVHDCARRRRSQLLRKP